MSIELGIIGAGSVARLHAEAALKAGARVACICDIDSGRAGQLAAQCPGAATTDSVETLLGRPEIEAVVVAVPNCYHKPVAIAAMQAGKDVLLEKPMAMSVAECDEIIAACRQTDRILQVGFVCRGAPAAMAARSLVEKGRLGRIYHVKASVYRQRGIPGLGRWFTTRAMSGGGALMDMGVHLVDLALHLTGFPRATRASAVCTSTFGSPIESYRYREMWGGPPDTGGVFDVEDAATALVRFDGGMSLEVNVTWAANVSPDHMRDAVVLLGDKAGCVIDIWSNELIMTTESDGKVVSLKQSLPGEDAWGDAWQLQAQRFCDCVRSRTPPEASAADGRAVQCVIDALYRSAAEEREVEVPECSEP
ncbi:MAG: Gfo/Idh/MocA family oxidoreductase [Planctomycetes bacterium]|nr:Gfo/Idh/MocA family oxidoreductase [Planctomycetota bacterium]